MLIQQTLDKLHALRLTGMVEAFEQQLTQTATHELAGACVEDIDYRQARGLKRAQLAQLASGQWVHQKHNLLITGPTGTGKTYLACALGNQACRQGLSTRYFRLPRLLEQIAIARGDGSYPRFMKQLATTELLILDDLAIAPLTASLRNDFMELIEDRHGLRSTLVGSQLPVDHWHDYLADPTLADAILDRLLHNAHRLPLTGASMHKNDEPKLDGS